MSSSGSDSSTATTASSSTTTSSDTSTSPSSSTNSSTQSPPPTSPPPSSSSNPPPNSTGDGNQNTNSVTSSASSRTTTTTLPNGSTTEIVQTIIVTETEGGPPVTLTSVAAVPTISHTGANDHIGAIVGGSVGGGVALALALLAFFIIARQRKAARHRAFDNDIFNPDHTTRGPNFDLGGGNDVIPVPYSYTPGEGDMREAANGSLVPGAHPGGPGLRHPGYHPDESYLGPGMVGMGAGLALGAGGAAALEHSHHLSETSSGLGRTGSLASSRDSSGAPLNAGRSSPGPGMGMGMGAPPSMMMAGAGAARGAKEREAFARTRARESTPPVTSPTHTHAQSASSVYSQTTAGGAVAPSAAYSHPPRAFTLGNPDTDPYGGARAASRGSRYSVDGPAVASPVVVHQDAGRVREEHDAEDEREIPPTYDSIPHDEAQRPASRPLSESGLAH